MQQNLENQIRILENSPHIPSRFCFEFPLDMIGIILDNLDTLFDSLLVIGV